MKTFAVFVAILFLLLFGWVVYGEAQTCAVAIKATPMGPFPCSVTMTWQDNSDNETGFILQRRLNGGPWAAIGGVLGVNVTSAIDTTLQQSATVDNLYEYQVSATNSAGTSSPSNVAAYTIPKSVTVPKPPSGITVTFKNGVGEMDLTPGRNVSIDGRNGVFYLSSADEITVEYH